MNGKLSKLIRKYCKKNDIIDMRDFSTSNKKSIIKMNPIKYIKQQINKERLSKKERLQFINKIKASI
jgi:hypothetical protein